MNTLYGMTPQQREQYIVNLHMRNAMEVADEEDACEDCLGTLRNRNQLVEYERRTSGSLKTETVLLCDECVPRCLEDGCNAVRHPFGEGGCIDHEIEMWKQEFRESEPGDPSRIMALAELTKLQVVKGRA